MTTFHPAGKSAPRRIVRPVERIDHPLQTGVTRCEYCGEILTKVEGTMPVSTGTHWAHAFCAHLPR